VVVQHATKYYGREGLAMDHLIRIQTGSSDLDPAGSRFWIVALGRQIIILNNNNIEICKASEVSKLDLRLDG